MSLFLAGHPITSATYTQPQLKPAPTTHSRSVRYLPDHNTSHLPFHMSRSKQTDPMRVFKALRRSIKGEKEGAAKSPHVSIAPKSALAIVPPKKVRHFFNPLTNQAVSAFPSGVLVAYPAISGHWR